ncbi:MAG: hypothetical protein KatS3mg087_1374 [Patescibacteria group bacterium]|nr:MAG: hypothetical protein KatS3mg087_1374 [Patescibacteria group bacterium]
MRIKNKTDPNQQMEISSISNKGSAGTISIQCAAKVTKNGEGLTVIKFQGYSGGPVDLSDYGFDAPVVYDIQSLSTTQKIPILLDHREPIGHTTSVRKVDNNTAVRGKGVLSIPNNNSEVVEKSLENGFPWQASMGLSIRNFDDFQYVSKGEVIVNGRSLKAPMYIVKNASLKEMSITVFGRDSDTSFTLSEEEIMKIKNAKTGQTVVDDNKNTQGETLKETPKETKNSNTTSQESRKDPETTIQVENKADDSVNNTVQTLPPVNTGGLDSNTRRAMRLLNKYPGQWELIEKGIDNGWDDEAIENSIRLEIMNSNLPKPPKPFQKVENGVLKEQCRMLLSMGTSPEFLEKRFGDKIVGEVYNSRPFSLVELLVQVANSTGGSFTGHSDVESMCRHIKNAGFSTFDLPDFFEKVSETIKDERWEINPPFAPRYCKEGSNRNFNTTERLRITGGDMWNQVQHDGKLELFAAGNEVRYTTDLETYGTVITFTRKDLVNDDLGAIQDLIDMMIEGSKIIPDYQLGKLMIQQAPAAGTFWVDDDNSYDNTPLTRANLSTLYNAIRQYQEQKERFQWNTMLNVRWTLITSPSLEEAAWEILNQSQIVQETGAASGTKTGSKNFWFGKMDQAVFEQMENTSAFGTSSKFVGAQTWILWPSTTRFAPYEITYLQGRRRPTIEPVDLPSSVLGFGLRGYWDVKINERERTAVIRATGTP